MSKSGRDLAKSMAFGAAGVCIAPYLLAFRLKSAVLGPDRALEAAWALSPTGVSLPCAGGLRPNGHH
jgi:hypothetical protein